MVSIISNAVPYKMLWKWCSIFPLLNPLEFIPRRYYFADFDVDVDSMFRFYFVFALFQTTESSKRKFVFVCAYIWALIQMERMELLVRSFHFFILDLFITWAFWHLSKSITFECLQFASRTRLMWIIWKANDRSSLRKRGLNLLDQLEMKYLYLPFYIYFCLIAGDLSIFIFVLFPYWKFSER